MSNHPRHDMDPDWSPDGTKIAFVTFGDGGSEIYVIGADEQEIERVTNEGISIPVGLTL